jgi:hypothetical protein
MNRLSILLLLSILSVSIANANLVRSSDVSIGTNSASTIVLEMNSDATNETTLSKFPSAAQMVTQTDSIPPTSWVIGLGLGLIFLGYKMKNKAH